MKRFELKYNEQKMKHYAIDHELKKQIGYNDMINLLNERDEKINRLNNIIQSNYQNIRSIYCDEINERDEKIKELEKKVSNGNQKLEDKFFEDLKKLDEEYNTDLNERLKEIEDLKQENKQLKQSQNNKAIEVLGKVRELVRDNSTASGFLFAEQNIDVEFFESLIDKQIAELEGEK